jgi:2-oxoglutarate ferredoxin oxidoreductase subunit gamma
LDKRSDRLEILIAGMGGQGVILLGTVIGTAAVVYEGKYATQAPSYGTETRGSPAESQVIISSKRIGFPEVEQADILVAMTQGALDRHREKLTKEPTVIVETDLVRVIPTTLGRVWKIPATRLSEQNLNSRSYANMVMLGAVVKLTGIVSSDAAKEAIKATVPPNTIHSNLQAFELGMEAARTEPSNRSNERSHH